jgi:hypothetical protein
MSPLPTSELQEALERALETKRLHRSDFSARADRGRIEALEASLGFPLPEDFRSFCTEIAARAPIPWTPPPMGRSSLFEVYVDTGGGPPRVDDLLVLEEGFGLSPTEHDRQRRPFPFTTPWKQRAPAACFGGESFGLASPGDLDRSCPLPGLPPGTSPFDGWLELWFEGNYADSYKLAYGLILQGPARNQVWAYSATYRGDLLFKPMSPSFGEWYLTWLQG